MSSILSGNRRSLGSHKSREYPSFDLRHSSTSPTVTSRVSRISPFDDECAPDRAHAFFDAAQHIAQQLLERRRLAKVTNAFGKIVAEDEKVVLEPPLGPALDPFLDRVHQHGRQRCGEDDRTFAAAVARIVEDDLLHHVLDGGEDGRDRQGDEREIGRTADRDVGIVKAETKQCDQQTKLQDHYPEGERNPGQQLD